jgi:hypothetical protein
MLNRIIRRQKIRQTANGLAVVALLTSSGVALSSMAYAQETERKESPLSFRIGGTDFTPGGFLDFESIFRTTRPIQPFVGVYGGGGFPTTNFSVDPQFNVNGSGVLGGGFGGVLLPVPNTNIQIGPRFGIQGSNITGSITSPAASPLFTYTVRTDWMAYQEAMVRIPVGTAFKIADNESPLPQNRAYFSYNFFDSVPHVTGSVGVAESGTSVKGTSGTFSVTDNAVRTGLTFTAGVDMSLLRQAALRSGNGDLLLFIQYRFTQWISTVNIPGAVNIGSFTNEVDVGLNFPFPPPPPP